MAKCDICGKSRIFGTSRTHHRGVAGGQWKRKAPKTQKIFKPNLHSAWVVNDGVKERWHLCTKCLRMVRKDQAAQKSASSLPTELHPGPVSRCPNEL